MESYVRQILKESDLSIVTKKHVRQQCKQLIGRELTSEEREEISNLVYAFVRDLAVEQKNSHESPQSENSSPGNKENVESKSKSQRYILKGQVVDRNNLYKSKHNSSPASTKPGDHSNTSSTAIENGKPSVEPEKTGTARVRRENFKAFQEKLKVSDVVQSVLDSYDESSSSVSDISSLSGSASESELEDIHEDVEKVKAAMEKLQAAREKKIQMSLEKKKNKLGNTEDTCFGSSKAKKKLHMKHSNEKHKDTSKEDTLPNSSDEVISLISCDDSQDSDNVKKTQKLDQVAAKSHKTGEKNLQKKLLMKRTNRYLGTPIRTGTSGSSATKAGSNREESDKRKLEKKSEKLKKKSSGGGEGIKKKKKVLIWSSSDSEGSKAEVKRRDKIKIKKKAQPRPDVVEFSDSDDETLNVVAAKCNANKKQEDSEHGITSKTTSVGNSSTSAKSSKGELGSSGVKNKLVSNNKSEKKPTVNTEQGDKEIEFLITISPPTEGDEFAQPKLGNKSKEKSSNFDDRLKSPFAVIGDKRGVTSSSSSSLSTTPNITPAKRVISSESSSPLEESPLAKIRQLHSNNSPASTGYRSDFDHLQSPATVPSNAKRAINYESHLTKPKSDLTKPKSDLTASNTDSEDISKKVPENKISKASGLPIQDTKTETKSETSELNGESKDSKKRKRDLTSDSETENTVSALKKKPRIKELENAINGDVITISDNDSLCGDNKTNKKEVTIAKRLVLHKDTDSCDDGNKTSPKEKINKKLLKLCSDIESGNDRKSGKHTVKNTPKKLSQEILDSDASTGDTPLAKKKQKTKQVTQVDSDSDASTGDTPLAKKKQRGVRKSVTKSDSDSSDDDQLTKKKTKVKTMDSSASTSSAKSKKSQSGKDTHKDSKKKLSKSATRVDKLKQSEIVILSESSANEDELISKSSKTKSEIENSHSSRAATDSDSEDDLVLTTIKANMENKKKQEAAASKVASKDLAAKVIKVLLTKASKVTIASASGKKQVAKVSDDSDSASDKNKGKRKPKRSSGKVEVNKVSDHSDTGSDNENTVAKSMKGKKKPKRSSGKVELNKASDHSDAESSEGDVTKPTKGKKMKTATKKAVQVISSDGESPVKKKIAPAVIVLSESEDEKPCSSIDWDNEEDDDEWELPLSQISKLNTYKEGDDAGSDEDDDTAGDSDKRSATANECQSLRLLRKICRECRLFVRNDRELKDCQTDKEKIAKCLELLREVGMKGKPSLRKAEEVKLRKEAAELSAENIISSETGRVMRKVKSIYARRQISPTKPSASSRGKASFKGLAYIVDDDLSDD